MQYKEIRTFRFHFFEDEIIKGLLSKYHLNGDRIGQNMRPLLVKFDLNRESIFIYRARTIMNLVVFYLYLFLNFGILRCIQIPDLRNQMLVK